MNKKFSLSKNNLNKCFNIYYKKIKQNKNNTKNRATIEILGTTFIFMSLTMPLGESAF